MKKKVILASLLIIIGLLFYSYGMPLPQVDRKEFETMYSTKTDNSIILKDGRTLAYAEYGDPDGLPMFYFHGGQESRLSSNFMDSTANSLNIRIIAPERPGIGLSSFQKDRSFLNYPNDIAQLANHLGIATFSVFGLSGGSPHVLACAYVFPERLQKIAIVSGTAPHNYKGKLKGMWFPVKLIHWFANSKKDKNLRGFIKNDYEALAQKPEKRLKQLQRFLPKPDRELLKAKPQYGIDFIKGSLESYRQGTDAVVQEWKLYVADWGFAIKEIEPKINLWYGDKDKMTPKYRGLHLHKLLPNSKLHLLEDEGHFSLLRNHLEAILMELKSD
ncbi:MAG: hypothetical protein COA50_10415 [Flavobacteriaceae bacterium]|nr:MAG: hypothetical protein COA50_10415 [Flavobacteriaceae bacterium]